MITDSRRHPLINCHDAPLPMADHLLSSSPPAQIIKSSLYVDLNNYISLGVFLSLPRSIDEQQRICRSVRNRCRCRRRARGWLPTDAGVAAALNLRLTAVFDSIGQVAALARSIGTRVIRLPAEYVKKCLTPATAPLNGSGSILSAG